MKDVILYENFELRVILETMTGRESFVRFEIGSWSENMSLGQGLSFPEVRKLIAALEAGVPER